MTKTVRIDDDVYDQMVREAAAAGTKTTRYINERLRQPMHVPPPPPPRARPKLAKRTASGKRFVDPNDCNHPLTARLENHCGACGSYVK